MKFKTENKHLNFGEVRVTQYGDGEIALLQLNDRIFITPKQAFELVEILQEAIKQEQQNERSTL